MLGGSQGEAWGGLHWGGDKGFKNFGGKKAIGGNQLKGGGQTIGKECEEGLQKITKKKKRGLNSQGKRSLDTKLKVAKTWTQGVFQ